MSTAGDNVSELAGLLTDVVRIDPAADAIDFEGRWYSWQQLAATIDAVRNQLAALDLGQDARVGVLARTRPSAFAAMLAVVGGNACMVSINPMLPDDRLAADCEQLAVPGVSGEEAALARPAVRRAA